MRHEKEEKEIVIRVKRETVITLFVVLVLLLTTLGVGHLMLRMLSIERNKQEIGRELGASYTDTNMNVLVGYPSDWSLAQLDMTGTELAVQEVVSGGVFNMDKHKLKKEVVSFMVVGDEGEEGGYRKFMTVSFKGDVGKRGEKLQADLTQSFQREIEETGVSGVKIIKKELVEDAGVYLEAECEYKGEVMYYVQYTGVFGQNMATVLLGVKGTEEDKRETVLEVYRSILNVNQNIEE